MRKILPCAAITLLLATLNAHLFNAQAQGTAFTYQGRLINTDTGNPANGNYDFRFRLALDPSGNTVVNVNAVLVTNQPVANGLFLTPLDFGTNVFTGSQLWLQIEVKTNQASSYALLSPLQAVTPSPYAIFANTSSNLSGIVSASQVGGTMLAGALAGTYSNSVILNNVGNSFSGSGSGLSGVNASTLNGLAATNLWSTAGNSGISPGNGNFLGTTDNQPLELRVNGLRTMRYEFGGASSFAISLGFTTPNGAPNVIAGSPVNFVNTGVVGAVIGGGGSTNYGPYSFTNRVGADFGTIGGGAQNQIQTTNARSSTIAGGELNVVTAAGAFIGGGGWDGNLMLGNTNGGAAGVIGGGMANQIQNGNSYSMIGGGVFNKIQPNASYATIGGGDANVASAIGAFVGGGGYDGSNIGGNTNAGAAGVIGGGVGNQIAGNFNSRLTVIGGGYYNQILSGAADAAICGGGNNVASSPGAFIGSGGWDGSMAGGNINAGAAGVIGGGVGNQIAGNFNSRGTFIGGGYFNQIPSGAADAVICGGGNNVASSPGAFIGGGGWDGVNIGGNTNAGNAAVVGGGMQNLIQSGANYTTIGGGEQNSIQLSANFATIAGGLGNQIQFNAYQGAIGGGFNNTIQSLAFRSVIAGGFNSQIQTNAIYSVIGGGSDNQIQINAIISTISGGGGNQIQPNAARSTIAGGSANKIQTNATFSVISGGASNSVSGALGAIAGGDLNVASTNSFAAGHRAKATSQGAFVWADATDADFYDAGTNTFNVRASGGVVFTNGAGQSVSWTPGSGSWAFTSDRNAKENFESVDTLGVLEKVAQLPLSEWSYRGFEERHVGPMAQDFHAAFPLNASDKMLNSADEAGITLAAVQGLNRKMETEAAALRAENARLNERLNALEKLIRQHESN